MSSQHFIVLNGKRYDAVTGAFLGAHAELPAAHKASRSEHTPAKAVHAPRIHTGQSRHAAPTAHAQQQHATASALKEAHQAAQTVAQPAKKSREHHGQPQHLKAHKPQTAKTLMRRVVRKPEEANKAAIKQHYPLKQTESGVSIEAPKRLAHNVDTSRQARAQQVHQSHHVGRYQATALKPIAPKVAQVAVAKEPKQQHHAASPSQHHKKAAAHAQTQPRPNSDHTAKQQEQPKPIKVDIFEQALADAKSHKEKSPKARNRTRRWLSATAAVASVLVLGGFVAFLNRSAIELQLASVQAGFAATMPAYVPEGFDQQDTTARDGAIAISFRSPYNERYTVSQEESNWDSQTLFDSLISKSGASYQVVQNNGRNIYIYDGSKAAWVDGGVLYKIDGNAKLDSDQLISIASSI